MKIIIAGGGTGGHIYPALSIAQAVQSIETSADILFVGTERGLEKKIIPKAGYNLKLIQSGQINLQGHFFKKIISLFKIPFGIFQSILIVLKYKPDFVLGVGGYASAPIMFVAGCLSKLTKLKVALWEPNAHPGMANRVLSSLINKSYLVFPEAAPFLKSKNNLLFGMPLRAEIENNNLDQEKTSVLEKPFTMLCFGGSQGSRFLNDQLSDLIIQNPQDFSKLKVIHQTGPSDFERIKKKYEGLKNIEVHEYIYNMPVYYNQADILFCRGGASTLAEAAMYGLVPIVVPLAAADDHQQRNAEALEKQNAAFMMLQNNFKMEVFKDHVLFLMNNPVKLSEMSNKLKSMVQKGASLKIAQDIVKTIKEV